MIAGQLRVFAPAIFVWAIAAWAIGTPMAPGITVIALCALLVFVSVLWGIPRTRRLASTLSTTVLVSLSFLLAMTTRIFWGHRIRQQLADAEFATLPETSVRLRLTSFPQTVINPRAEDEERYTLTGTSSGVPIRVWGEGHAQEHWVPGSQVDITGTFQTQETASPQAIALTGTVSDYPDTSPVMTWYADTLSGLRHGLVRASAEVPGADLMPGFAVGDTSLVSPALDAAMIESSLSHLVAVSGANCALVTGVMIWVITRLGGGRSLRIIVALGALAGFVVVVGPDTSIQRAAIMATITLAGVVAGRASLALPALGWAVMILLLADPWQARQAGFVLSVAATAGIVLCAPAIHDWCTSRLRMPTPISLTLSVTLAAQLACGPFLLLLQPGIAAGGVLANLVTAPAAPIGTGTGLLAMLTLPWNETLGNWCVVAGSVATGWVEWVAGAVSEAPGARWYWPEGPAGAVLLAVAEGVLVVTVALRRQWPKKPWGLTPRFTRAKHTTLWVLTATGVSVIAMVMVVEPLGVRSTTPRDWFLVACDVGQGDAIMIRDPTSHGSVMLVDTGEDPEDVATCLTRFGVTQINTLVLTHDHLDHIGGLDAVIDRSEQVIIAKPLTGHEDEPRSLRTQLEAANLPLRHGVDGVTGVLPGPQPVPWRVIGPHQDEIVTDHNPASVVLEVSLPEHTLVLLGDTGEEQHRQLLQRYPDLRADVVKVAHHGSNDHAPELITQLDADYAVISSGEGNSYGHPGEEALTSLAEANTAVLRTDTCGTIALTSGDGAVRVWCEKAATVP